MQCLTKFIDDTPPPRDQLRAGGDGGHDLIAKAIANLIRSNEEGGKLIGLEGRWGSGKTTIVNLMRRHLASESTESGTTVFVFDAWAHERDPLRRRFLESLIAHFQDVGWIEETHWDDVVATLSERRKRTRTHTVPRTTKFGKFLAISSLFVPLGTVLVAGSFQDRVVPDSWFPWTVWFVVGLVLSAAPLVVVLFNVGRGLLRWINDLRRRDDDDDSSNDMTRTTAASDWALLTDNVTSETIQETAETPDPTSIEFEREFGRLMEAALSGARRTVLVLDNLDRVTPDDALGIWSTLQTFLQRQESSAATWFNKTWVVVPYDRLGLRRLWTVRGDAPATKAENEVGDVAESFIDKSVQIRFEVPAPVLSDWRLYIAQLVKEAMPGHEKDAHDFYRVYNQTIVKSARSPTPRELKIYINQIGALHLQWEHKVPMSHLAYYAALQRKYQTSEKIRKALIDGDVPARSITPALPRSLRTNLSGLVFNVEATIGQQLLLTEPISKALSGGKQGALRRLEAVHGEGFWVVLQEVIGGTATAGPDVVCSSVLGLNASGILANRKKGNVPETILEVRNVMSSVTTWSPITEDTIPAISAACRLVASVQFAGRVCGVLRKTLEEGVSAGRQLPESRTIISQVMELARGIRKAGHGKVLGHGQFVLPSDADEWIADCAVIGAESAEMWSLFRPRAVFAEILSRVVGEIRHGRISGATLATIQVSQRSGIAETWEPVSKAIDGRVNQNVDATERELLMRGRALL